MDHPKSGSEQQPNQGQAEQTGTVNLSTDQQGPRPPELPQEQSQIPLDHPRPPSQKLVPIDLSHNLNSDVRQEAMAPQSSVMEESFCHPPPSLGYMDIEQENRNHFEMVMQNLRDYQKDQFQQEISQNATFLQPNLDLDSFQLQQVQYDFPNQFSKQIEEIFQKGNKFLSVCLQQFFIKNVNKSFDPATVQVLITDSISMGLQNIRYIHLPLAARGYIYKDAIRLNLYQVISFIQDPKCRPHVIAYCVLSLIRLLASYVFQNLIGNPHENDTQKQAFKRFFLRHDLGHKFEQKVCETQQFYCASETDYNVLKNKGFFWEKLGKRGDHDLSIIFQTKEDIQKSLEQIVSKMNSQRKGRRPQRQSFTEVNESQKTIQYTKYSLDGQVAAQINAIISKIKPILIKNINDFFFSQKQKQGKQGEHPYDMDNMKNLISEYLSNWQQSIEYISLKVPVSGYVFKKIKVNMHTYEKSKVDSKQIQVAYCVMVLFRLLASYTLQILPEMHIQYKNQQEAIHRYAERKDLGSLFLNFCWGDFQCANVSDYQMLIGRMLIISDLGKHIHDQNVKCVLFQTIKEYDEWRRSQPFNRQRMIPETSQMFNQRQQRYHPQNLTAVRSQINRNPFINTDQEPQNKNKYHLDRQVFDKIQKIFSRKHDSIIRSLVEFINEKSYNQPNTQGKTIQEYLEDGLRNIEAIEFSAGSRGYVFKDKIIISVQKFEKEKLNIPDRDRDKVLVAYCVMNLVRLLASYALQKRCDMFQKNQLLAMGRFRKGKDLGFIFEQEKAKFLCASYKDYQILQNKQREFPFQTVGKHNHQQNQKCVMFQIQKDDDLSIEEILKNRQNAQKTTLEARLNIRYEQRRDQVSGSQAVRPSQYQPNPNSFLFKINNYIFQQIKHSLEKNVAQQVNKFIENSFDFLRQLLAQYYLNKRNQQDINKIQDLIYSYLEQGFKKVEYIILKAPLRGYVYDDKIKVNLYWFYKSPQDSKTHKTYVAYCVLTLFRLLASYSLQKLYKEPAMNHIKTVQKYLKRKDLGCEFLSGDYQLQCASEMDYDLLVTDNFVLESLGKHKYHESKNVKCVKFQKSDQIIKWFNSLVSSRTRIQTNRQRVPTQSNQRVGLEQSGLQNLQNSSIQVEEPHQKKEGNQKVKQEDPLQVHFEQRQPKNQVKLQQTQKEKSHKKEKGDMSDHEDQIPSAGSQRNRQRGPTQVNQRVGLGQSGLQNSNIQVESWSEGKNPISPQVRYGEKMFCQDKVTKKKQPKPGIKGEPDLAQEEQTQQKKPQKEEKDDMGEHENQN